MATIVNRPGRVAGCPSRECAWSFAPPNAARMVGPPGQAVGPLPLPPVSSSPPATDVAFEMDDFRKRGLGKADLRFAGESRCEVVLQDGPRLRYGLPSTAQPKPTSRGSSCLTPECGMRSWPWLL